MLAVEGGDEDVRERDVRTVGGVDDGPGAAREAPVGRVRRHCAGGPLLLEPRLSGGVDRAAFVQRDEHGGELLQDLLPADGDGELGDPAAVGGGAEDCDDGVAAGAVDGGGRRADEVRGDGAGCAGFDDGGVAVGERVPREVRVVGSEDEQQQLPGDCGFDGGGSVRVGGVEAGF